MMRLDYASHTAAQVVSLNLVGIAEMFALTLKDPVNPQDIVTVNDAGFRVNVNKMELGKFYLVEFMDARYLIWKNKDEALVMTEVS